MAYTMGYDQARRLLDRTASSNHTFTWEQVYKLLKEQAKESESRGREQVINKFIQFMREGE